MEERGRNSKTDFYYTDLCTATDVIARGPLQHVDRHARLSRVSVDVYIASTEARSLLN